MNFFRGLLSLLMGGKSSTPESSKEFSGKADLSEVGGTLKSILSAIKSLDISREDRPVSSPVEKTPSGGIVGILPKRNDAKSGSSMPSFSHEMPSPISDCISICPTEGESLGEDAKEQRSIREGISGQFKMNKGVMAAAGKLKAFGGAVVAVIDKVVKLALKIDKWAESVVESNRELSLFSPKLMTAQMEEMFAEFERRQDMALATEESATRAQRSRTAAKDAWQPVEQQWKSIENHLANIWNHASTGVARQTDILTEMIGIKDIVERIEGQGTGREKTAGVQTLSSMGVAGQQGSLWWPNQNPLANPTPLDPIE